MSDLDDLLRDLAAFNVESPRSSSSSYSPISSPRALPPSPLSTSSTSSSSAASTSTSSPPFSPARLASSLSSSTLISPPSSPKSGYGSPRAMAPSPLGSSALNTSDIADGGSSNSELDAILGALKSDLVTPRELGTPRRSEKTSAVDILISNSISSSRKAADRKADLAELTNLALEEGSLEELLQFDAQLAFEMALRRGEREEVIIAAQGLTNLGRFEAGRSAIRVGTIRQILQTMEDCGQDEEVLEKLFGALTNLAIASELLVNCGLFRTISKVITKDTHRGPLLHRVLTLLVNSLKDSRLQSQLEASDPSLAGLVVRLAISNDHERSIMGLALMVFAGVSRASPSFQKLWVDAGLLRTLPRCFEVSLHARHEEDLRSVLVTIVNFAANDHHVPALQSAGVIAALIKGLRVATQPIQTLILQALQNFSTGDSCCLDIASHGGVSPILSALQNHASHDQTVLFALSLIQNLSAVPSVRSQLNGAAAQSIVSRFTSHSQSSITTVAQAALANLKI